MTETTNCKKFKKLSKFVPFKSSSSLEFSLTANIALESLKPGKNSVIYTYAQSSVKEVTLTITYLEKCRILFNLATNAKYPHLELIRCIVQKKVIKKLRFLSWKKETHSLWPQVSWNLNNWFSAEATVCAVKPRIRVN